MPETRPDTPFFHGICAACRSHAQSQNVDWDARWETLCGLAREQRTDSFNCVVPVSGGKDSCLQVMKALEAGFRPLCVHFETTLPTDLGHHNLEVLQNFGVDLFHVKINPRTMKRLTEYGFESAGVAQLGLFLGAYVAPVQVALRFEILACPR